MDTKTIGVLVASVVLGACGNGENAGPTPQPIDAGGPGRGSASEAADARSDLGADGATDVATDVVPLNPTPTVSSWLGTTVSADLPPTA